MTKRIISLILIIATMLSVCAITASAASGEEFISEIALVYEDSVEDAKAAIAGTDWKLWEQDLNPNADYMIDDGVYLIYKTSTNVEDAITDLRVMDMYGGFSTSNYEKQLEASREAYLRIVNYIRTVAAEFKARYDEGDAMAKLAYRQMNYYRDIGGTNLRMGEFIMNLNDENASVEVMNKALVTVMMEGNAYIITNLVTIMAVALSGGKTFAERLSETYELRDTYTDLDYYERAEAIIDKFVELNIMVKRYDALVDQYDLKDEEMTEEEADFVVNYASIALAMEAIPYGEGTLKDFAIRGNWEVSEFYPIVAALSEGQQALAEMGVFTTVLQYAAPSKPIDELYALVEEVEAEMTDENGKLKEYDVYMGVDRSIFKGNFAFTNSAQRQQALTGKDWTSQYYLDEEAIDNIPVAAVASVAGVGIAVTVFPFIAKAILKSAIDNAASHAIAMGIFNKWKGLIVFLSNKKMVAGAAVASGTSGVKILAAAGIGLIVAAAGIAGVSVWYGYYNPDYTPIPDNMIDIRETDIGDKYVKFTAAKVFGDKEGRNADLNAYEGKEWIALYYTKDANAGKCLTPNFVYSDNDSTIARRHQGISMFGETKAFNLNSHVFSKNAPGVYVTIRYSTAKKAAADMPDVVGSVFSGAFYALTALGGIGIGIGATVLVQKGKKKKETAEN